MKNMTVSSWDVLNQSHRLMTFVAHFDELCRSINYTKLKHFKSIQLKLLWDSSVVKSSSPQLGCCLIS